jgi:hypothetical protein
VGFEVGEGVAVEDLSCAQVLLAAEGEAVDLPLEVDQRDALGLQLLTERLQLVTQRDGDLRPPRFLSLHSRVRLLVAMQHQEEGQLRQFLQPAPEVRVGGGEEKLELVAHEDEGQSDAVVEEVGQVLHSLLNHSQRVAARGVLCG